MNARCLLILLVLVSSPILSSACIRADDSLILERWQPASLRLLDADDAGIPQADLIALYMRKQNDRVQIRLDLLEASFFEEADFYLVFDTGPGGVSSLPFQGRTRMDWDVLLSIPVAGPIRLTDPNGQERAGAAILVWRDPQLEAILIDLNIRSLSDELDGINFGAGIHLQAFATHPGSSEILDQTDVFSLHGSPPYPANLLLAFWNTYPAYTPATALRRWDGAHTGPLGGRHGLHNLLRTAKAAKIPISLLDLNDPLQLSALEYAGGLELIRSMQSAGLLTSPAPYRAQSASSRYLSSQGIARRSLERLPASLELQHLTWKPVSVSSSADRPSSGGGGIFNIPNPGRPQQGSLFLSLERWKGYRVFHMTPPVPADEQVNWEGLSLESKRRLIQAAMRQNSRAKKLAPEYVQLGGELPASSWGDPRAARAAFRWLNDHPWVRPLNNHALQSAPSASSNLSRQMHAVAEPWSTMAPNPALFAALQQLPDNPISLAAIQAYEALFAPVYPFQETLPDLRTHYTSQVWSLIEASKWAQAPFEISSCASDPDRDGEPECVLASKTTYAQFEIKTASMTFLFGFEHADPAFPTTSRSVHQIIGPSSQFIIGLSEQDTWNLGAGLAADPGVIPGAFSGPGEGFAATINAGSLIFSDRTTGMQKVYYLKDKGISLQIYRRPPLPADQSWTAVIPLALDPWLRFYSAWPKLYNARSEDNTFEWAIDGGPHVVVRSDSVLQPASFLDSLELFSAPEDPNREPPVGYYLPFPLALVEVDDPSQIQILLQPGS